jgi:endonuclease/exonuclease/phosphatase family metal-dependent hydrolase
MPLSVMTFNLLFEGAVNPAGAWTARLPLVLDVLRAGVDIVALQEATDLQLRAIADATPEFTLVTGPESGETRIPRLVRRAARRGEHCAILYRTDRFEAVDGSAFWLSRKPHAPGSVLFGTWLPRVVNWVRLRDRTTDTVFTVYNAHLDFLPWAPLRSARILRRMLDTSWDGTLQILMGDFNAYPGSGAYKYLGKTLRSSNHPPLVDAWHVAAQRFGPPGTFHGGTGRIRWMGRLDRILFRPTGRVERVETITHHRGSAYPSDHYPVRAQFDA